MTPSLWQISATAARASRRLSKKPIYSSTQRSVGTNSPLLCAGGAAHQTNTVHGQGSGEGTNGQRGSHQRWAVLPENVILALS